MEGIIKGKVCWIPVETINRIAPEIDTSDFKDIEELYDVCDELLTGEGFITSEGDLKPTGEVLDNGYYDLRYDTAIVRGTKREGKFIIKEVGIAFEGIRNSRQTDLDKLVYARNHLRVKTTHGKPDDDSLKAWEYLDGYIRKMQELSVKNIKELLK